MTAEHPAEIECPECGGHGCNECDDGWFTVSECPSKFIGQQMISDILVTAACEHHLPVAGGLLDQSAWWFELRQRLQSEEHKITEEQMKRHSK